MPIRLSCVCGKRFQIREELADRRLRCPSCRAILVMQEAKRGGRAAIQAPSPSESIPPTPRSKEDALDPVRAVPRRRYSWLWIVGAGLALGIGGGTASALLLRGQRSISDATASAEAVAPPSELSPTRDQPAVIPGSEAAPPADPAPPRSTPVAVVPPDPPLPPPPIPEEQPKPKPPPNPAPLQPPSLREPRRQDAPPAAPKFVLRASFTLDKNKKEYVGNLLVFSPGGKTLLTFDPSSWKGFSLWDVATGKENRLPPILGDDDRDDDFDEKECHCIRLRFLFFEPDGKSLTFATAKLSKTRRSYWDLGRCDIATGKKEKLAHEEAKDSRELPPLGVIDGKPMAIRPKITEFGTVNLEVWDVIAAKRIATMADRTPHLYASSTPPVFSPNGRVFVSEHVDRSLRLWDVAAQKLRTILKPSSSPWRMNGESPLCFSPDSKILAVSLQKNGPHASRGTDEVRIHDVESGRQLATLAVLSRFVAFSPDGKLLATESFGGVILWDTTSWRECARLPRQTTWIRTLAFSPDSQLLATTGGGSTIDLWNIRPTPVELELGPVGGPASK